MNWRVLSFVVGFALMLLGTFTFETLAHFSIVGDEVLTIPDGAENYTYLQVDMPGGGPVSGTYESVSGGEIMIMLLDGGQFDHFLEGKDHGSRFADTGTSGSFSIEQVDMERFSIVHFHAGGESAAQEVRVTYDVDTIDSNRAWIGMGVLIAGFATLLVGGIVHVLKVKAATPPPKYIDVVFFDERTK